MSIVSLQSIREAADVKYGSLDIPLDDDYAVKLLNPLRLSDENRAALIAAQDLLSADDADQKAILRDCIRLVAATGEQGERLIEAIGDDLAVLVEVFGEYTKGTQAGEASASDD